MPNEVKQLSVSEAIELISWEFSHLQLIHNAPLVDAAKINDDVRSLS